MSFIDTERQILSQSLKYMGICKFSIDWFCCTLPSNDFVWSNLCVLYRSSIFNYYMFCELYPFWVGISIYFVGIFFFGILLLWNFICNPNILMLRFRFAVIMLLSCPLNLNYIKVFFARFNKPCKWTLAVSKSNWG